MLVDDVDLSMLTHAREHGTVRNWRDRRTDLYGLRIKKGKIAPFDM